MTDAGRRIGAESWAGGSGRSSRSCCSRSSSAAYVASGTSLVRLIGSNPPPADEFDVRRVEFKPGEIKVRVTNPQQEDLTIASVTVDDAIVPFELDGPQTLGRLRSSTIVIPYRLGRGRPDDDRRDELDRDRDRRGDPGRGRDAGLHGDSVFGYAIIGFLVGVLPVALGLLWLPSLRRAEQRWLTAFMALTGGLLTFLGVEALFEAFQLQAAVPGAFGGPGPRAARRRDQLPDDDVHLDALLGRGRRRARRGGARDARRDRDRPAQLRRGARDRHVVRVRAADARLVPDRRLHDPQRHRGARDRRAGRGRGRALSLGRLGALAADRGRRRRSSAPGPGGFIANDVLAVLFFGAAAGAAFEVVVEVARYVARRDPAGLRSGWAIGGFLAGIAVMYVTGLLRPARYRSGVHAHHDHGGTGRSRATLAIVLALTLAYTVAEGVGGPLAVSLALLARPRPRRLSDSSPAAAIALLAT